MVSNSCSTGNNRKQTQFYISGTITEKTALDLPTYVLYVTMHGYNTSLHWIISQMSIGRSNPANLR